MSHREPLRTTLVRTFAIAVVMGAFMARWWGGWSHWPLAIVLALWPSLGGHWVEIWFLNWLRPRLPGDRAIQTVARLGTWYVGGTILGLGMHLTALALSTARPTRWPAWWMGGLAFIGVELVAHLALQLRGAPSFYNGRG